jgi:hypothetical protein
MVAPYPTETAFIGVHKKSDAFFRAGAEIYCISEKYERIVIFLGQYGF